MENQCVFSPLMFEPETQALSKLHMYHRTRRTMRAAGIFASCRHSKDGRTKESLIASVLHFMQIEK